MPKFIVSSVANSRSAVRENQVEHLVLLIRELDEAVQRARLGIEDCDQFFKMAEYGRFHSGAYATGFVCTDLSAQGFDHEHIASRPELLADCDLRKLRHYVHSLLRCERHSYPYSSFVLNALLGGALGLVAQRLQSDQRLRAPDVPCEETLCEEHIIEE